MANDFTARVAGISVELGMSVQNKSGIWCKPSERNVYRNIQSGKLEAVEREVMIPTLKKFVTEEALEKYKAGRAS